MTARASFTDVAVRYDEGATKPEDVMSPGFTADNQQFAELAPRTFALQKVGDYTEEAILNVINDAQVGDFLILHGKIAVAKIDPQEALEMLEGKKLERAERKHGNIPL